jgi:hypothetical protein
MLETGLLFSSLFSQPSTISLSLNCLSKMDSENLFENLYLLVYVERLLSTKEKSPGQEQSYED